MATSLRDGNTWYTFPGSDYWMIIKQLAVITEQLLLNWKLVKTNIWTEELIEWRNEHWIKSRWESGCTHHCLHASNVHCTAQARGERVDCNIIVYTSSMYIVKPRLEVEDWAVIFNVYTYPLFTVQPRLEVETIQPRLEAREWAALVLFTRLHCTL